MKFASSQLAYLIGNREARGNLRALLKYLLTPKKRTRSTCCN